MGRSLSFCLCTGSLILTLYFYINSTDNDFEENDKHIDPAIVVIQHEKNLKGGHDIKCAASYYYNKTVKVYNKWQSVNRNSDWRIYSAYTDKRVDNPIIRILSLTKKDWYKKLYCRIWHSTENSSVTEVEKRELWIHTWDFAKPGQYFQPYLLSCPVVSDPIAVSIVEDPCEQPNNFININHAPKNKLKSFAICLKPLNFHEDISFKLLEWLELQFILGVDKIFVYIYTVHPKTWKVLKHYEKQGKVSLQIHELPKINSFSKSPNAETKSRDLWQKRRHEMLIYNDCFYRHINSHRFVVNLDLDEAIVPIFHDTWSQLLNNATAGNSRLEHSASLSVRNVYFFDSFGKVNSSIVQSRMHMLSHIYRSANFTPPGFAQKSFFNTNLTLTVSNHFALQALRSNTYALSAIDEYLAHLHHYRKDCPSLMEKDCKNNYMKFHQKDTALWKFKEKILKNIQKSSKVIGLIEIVA